VVDDNIADVLAEEAEAFEDAKEAPPQGRRVRIRHAEDPSQAYSIRIPVARLEQIRRLAESRGVTPTALVRQWVLQRLDQECGGAPGRR
jgi:hypothetical protein